MYVLIWDLLKPDQDSEGPQPVQAMTDEVKAIFFIIVRWKNVILLNGLIFPINLFSIAAIIY